jgi:hypothetical protein
MKNWSDYKKLLLNSRYTPFTANTNTWNANFEMVSTRSHFDLQTGELNTPHSTEDYYCLNVPGSGGIIHPDIDNYELIIYIHGVWSGPLGAREQLGRIELSLKSNGYLGPVVSYSWDSNTAINPSGWAVAKSIANQNGQKLAKFLSDYKVSYPNDNVRIIAHSLGAKVVESALISLDNNQTWKNNSAYNITSIHLMGAAISNTSASKNEPFGIAIDSIVNSFYNLYNSEDKVLQTLYENTENENPLGLFGINNGVPTPTNYTEYNVKSEIPPLKNASGMYQPFSDKSVSGWGDNHSGYIGFRERYPLNKSHKDDGAVNLIVRDWKGNYRS